MVDKLEEEMRQLRDEVSDLRGYISLLEEKLAEIGKIIGQPIAAEARAAIARKREEELADGIAKAMQQARDEIGATEQQRIAFAYAEAAMRAALPTMPKGNGDG